MFRRRYLQYREPILTSGGQMCYGYVHVTWAVLWDRERRGSNNKYQGIGGREKSPREDVRFTFSPNKKKKSQTEPPKYR